MVTRAHEAVHRIFRKRTETIVPVCRALGVNMPLDTRFEKVDTDCTEDEPIERRVDTVMRGDTPDGKSFLLAVESQGKPAPGKPRTWSYYLSYLAERYELDVLLLVTTQNPATARWAHGPFDFGTAGHTAQRLYPIVAGPGQVAGFLDPEEAARQLPLATVAAMLHGKSRGVSG